MSDQNSNQNEDNQSGFHRNDLKILCAKYKKYIAAGAMAALLAVVIFVNQNSKSQNAGKPQDSLGSDKEAGGVFEANTDPQVNKLVKEYYSCYAKGDVEAIEKIAYPITKAEKSYIKLFSSYLDKYEDIKCYTKQGASDGEYIVYVSHNMKFKGIDSGAPGQERFYVRMDENGTLYIDNAYSQFNQSRKENTTDEEINTLLADAEEDSSVDSLHKQIQEEYDSALKKDKKLKKMVTDTIKDALGDWAADFGSQSSTDNQNTGNGSDQASLRRTAYAKTNVNLRKKRSTDSEVIKTLKPGAKVTIYGVSKNGWFKVKNGNDTGFVKKEYLVSDKSKIEGADNSSSSGNVKKRTAYVKTRVNLRKKRSTDSEVLRTLEAGTKVTIYGTSKNGWFRIKAESNTGYVKKEYIVSDMSKVEKADDPASGSSEEKRTAYAKTKVNLRKKRSTDSEVVKTLEAGTKVTVYGSGQNGWYQVKAAGASGYVRMDYIVSNQSDVENAQNTQQASQADVRYYNGGERITLSEPINVRSSMSESADRVGLAYQGDVVTVVMSYAEGWTKVSWNGKTGYIKTELLK